MEKETDRWVRATFVAKSERFAYFMGETDGSFSLEVPSNLLSDIAIMQNGQNVALQRNGEVLRGIQKLFACELSFFCLLPEQGGVRQAEFTDRDRKVWILDVPKELLSRVEKLGRNQKLGLYLIIDSSQVLAGKIFEISYPN